MFRSHQSAFWPSRVVLTVGGLSMSPIVVIILTDNSKDYPT